MLEIARREASRYRRLPWVEVEEVAQEALLAMLQAKKTWNKKEAHNGELGAYLCRAAQYAARCSVWTAASPLKHSGRGDLPKQASSVRRAEETALHATPSHFSSPETAVAEKEWRQEVRIRFVELLGEDADCDQLIAWRVLVEQEPVECVAAEENVAPRAVFVVTQRIRNRIFADSQMRQLLKQKAR